VLRARTTDLTVLHRVAYAFLEDVAARFHGTYSGGNLKDASNFSRVLKERMDYYSYDPEADKISQVKQQIDEVKGVMVSNIGECASLHCVCVRAHI
jgi:hypothetical protein